MHVTVAVDTVAVSTRQDAGSVTYAGSGRTLTNSININIRLTLY